MTKVREFTVIARTSIEAAVAAATLLEFSAGLPDKGAKLAILTARELLANFAFREEADSLLMLLIGEQFEEARPKFVAELRKLADQGTDAKAAPAKAAPAKAK